MSRSYEHQYMEALKNIYENGFADFITERQYKEFMSRAKELGIETRCTYDDLIVKYMNKYNVNLPVVEVKFLLPNVELPEDLLEDSISKM